MDATVDRAFKKLEANLEELTKLYRALLDVVRKEKEILIRADRSALDENNFLKEDLLFKLRAQDSLRSRYAMDLAALVGAEVDNPRLLELAQKLAGSSAADRLRNQHAALDILIRRITAINKENEEYVSSALSTLSGAIDDIKDSLTGKKTYGEKGKYKAGSQAAGHFVSKEV